MNEVVTVLRNVTGDGRRGLPGDLDAKPVPELPRIPVGMVRGKACRKLLRARRLAGDPPHDRREEVAPEILFHVRTCFVVRQPPQGGIDDPVLQGGVTGRGNRAAVADASQTGAGLQTAPHGIQLSQNPAAHGG